MAKEGAKHGVRANVICPGFVRTPLVDKQIPEQSKALGISEDDVIKKVMLKETVDGEFTTTDDVAADRPLLRRLPDQRTHRPVARRQPRLVHAVAPAPT
jgi:3-hydroxybutyrate dehydrogenase